MPKNAGNAPQAALIPAYDRLGRELTQSPGIFTVPVPPLEKPIAKWYFAIS
jgi:hypothetical protein